MAAALTDEIMARTDTPHFEIDQGRITSLCREYLTNGIYRVLLACDNGKSGEFAPDANLVGVLALGFEPLGPLRIWIRPDGE